MRNRKRYSEDWFNVIRPRELARAKFKCENCGIKQRAVGYYDKNGHWVECDKFMANWALNNGFKVRKIALQVMHKDQNPSNNDSTNLSVACPKCHLNHDREYNRLSRIADKAAR